MEDTETRTLAARMAGALSVPLTAALLLVGAAVPAAANEPSVDNPMPEGPEAILTCNTRAAITGDLQNGYAEQPIALGVTSAGTVMELWTTANGNTWTLIVTMSNGDSCVVGAGDDWTTIQKTAAGKDL